ncbi:MAG: hypothetical protein M1835_007824 [Candelina submexicana]|nr:MAG: hypothetical protein M1835_007824 [Candelina submexicana]
MPFRLTEPHPSVSSSHYIGTGRGGAGNIKHIDPRSVTPSVSASGPASCAVLTPPPSSGRFASGRGGSGNIHHNTERAMFSFDEELARQQKIEEHVAPVYHIGRGGAGNAVDETRPSSIRKGSASSTMSRSSNESEGRRSGVFGRLSHTFQRV